MMTSDHPPSEEAEPTVRQLFVGFLLLGMMGFGGVLPLARAMLVEQRRWLTAAEFTDLLGLCQFLPGGNIVNMSVAVGMKFRGISGAVASIAGLIAMPTAIVIALGTIYDRYQNDPHVRHLFTGLAAAAAGLLLSTALKILWPLRGKPAGLAIAAVAVLAIAVLKLPLLLVLLTLAPMSILAAWRLLR
ncbi:MAG: chromate transporter [Hyphomicrobiaceae bacterium]|nr:chromate transporter [Hyphomicrobiaceae bacterium]